MRTRKIATLVLTLFVNANIMQFATAATADVALMTGDMTRTSTQRIAVQQAAMALVTESSDIDGDGFLESPAMLTGAGGPVGGGLIPLASSAPKNDSYGGNLGYCAWDNGSTNNSVNRITGSTNSPSAPVLAVISAGIDGVFQTTCANIAAGQGAQGDDYVVSYNSTQIQMGVSGTLFFGDPVPTVAALNALSPATLKDGQVRVVKATNAMYSWNAGLSTWVSITGGSSLPWVQTGSSYISASPIGVSGGSNVGLTSGSYYTLTGSESGTNVVADTTSIQARNNGVASTLSLNPLGGSVTANGSPVLTVANLTSSNVTNALGYTPLNQAGGTVSGALQVTGSLTTSTALLVQNASQVPGSYSAIALAYAGAGNQYGMTLRPTADNATAINFLNAAGNSVGSISQTASGLTFNGTATNALTLGGVSSANYALLTGAGFSGPISAPVVIAGTGTSALSLQQYTGGGWGAIYSTAVTPNSSNYAFVANATDTIVNAPSNVHIRVSNGGDLAVFSPSTVNINVPLTVANSLSLTAASGTQYFLLGNQDSGGVNNPAVIRASNGQLSFGNGTSWAAAGGTVSTYATFTNSGISMSVPLTVTNTITANGLTVNGNANVTGVLNVGSGVAASGVTAYLAHGADNNFLLTAQNGSSSNVSGAEVSRFGINYGGGAWNTYFQFLRGSGSQDGSMNVFAGNTQTAAFTSNGVGIAGTLTVGGRTTLGSTAYTGAGTNSSLNVLGDITATRAGGNSGVLYLSNTGSDYLYYDGATYWLGSSSNGAFNVSRTGAINASSATLTGNLTASTSSIGTMNANVLNLQRYSTASSGISWYSNSYNTWFDYMAPSGTGNGPRGNITAPSGSLVTSWARRSLIENAPGYGWTFESGSNSGTTPSVVAEIRASDGSARFAGDLTVGGNIYPSTVSNTGGGSFIFGSGAWSGSGPAISGISAVAGIAYNNGSGSQLFTLASGPGQMSMQMDGSLFVGDNITYNPFGTIGSTSGSLVVQNNASFGGSVYANHIMANASGTSGNAFGGGYDIAGGMIAAQKSIYSYGTMCVGNWSGDCSYANSGTVISASGINIGGANVLTSSNYTSYAPSLTGAGATGTWAINVTGSANTLMIGGSATTFNWSGQPGQPTWVWGGNSPGNMYVYNPANFSVNYASTAGTLSNGSTITDIYNNGWYRSNGQTGWYNQTYGGGIYMTDSTYVRTYASKSFHSDAFIDANSGFTIAGTTVVDSSRNVQANAVIAANYIQPGQIAASGSSCGAVGSIGRDASGNLYVCN